MRQVKQGTEASRTESQARRIADALRSSLPKDLGFTLFIFDQGKPTSEIDPTRITYMSTANRADMLATIRAWLAKVAP